MNVQFAVKANRVFVLEVNPRASRTVPFVSKAIGVPLAKIAARWMAARRSNAGCRTSPRSPPRTLHGPPAAGPLPAGLTRPGGPPRSRLGRIRTAATRRQARAESRRLVERTTARAGVRAHRTPGLRRDR